MEALTLYDKVEELKVIIQKIEQCLSEHTLSLGIEHNICSYIEHLKEFLDKGIKLSKLFPNIQFIIDKQKREFYYTSEVNEIVDKFEVIHYLHYYAPDIELFIEVDGIRIHSEPSIFKMNGNWEQDLTEAKIPLNIIDQIRNYNKRHEEIFKRK